MSEEVFIPKLGQTVEEVTIIDWLAEDGAEVQPGQEILEVETDKAVFPIEAQAKGYLHIGPYPAGDVVPVLEVVAIIGAKDAEFTAQSEAETEPAPAAASTSAPPVAQPAATAETTPSDGDRVFASPRARRLAAQSDVDLTGIAPTGGNGVRVVEQDVLDYLAAAPRATPVARNVAADAGIDLRSVDGSGPKGVITKADVQRAMAAEAPPVASPVTAGPAVAGSIPLSGPRGIIAARMAASVAETARVTLLMEVDATALVDVRLRLKERVAEAWGFAPGYNDLLAQIVATALREHPEMNARIVDDRIEHLAEVNLGMAVDTERGLLVPVIPQADTRSLRELGTLFRQLVEEARSGRISPDRLTGGTFTITNLGMYDVMAFTPIINLPEAAILGVGAITPRPVSRGGEIVTRQMTVLSLAFDHRLVDGAPAARFLQRIKHLIEEPYLLLAG